MLDMFKRPDDPPEYNKLYAIPGAAMLATYAAGHFTGTRVRGEAALGMLRRHGLGATLLSTPHAACCCMVGLSTNTWAPTHPRTHPPSCPQATLRWRA
jgi:hypothetical protein